MVQICSMPRFHSIDSQVLIVLLAIIPHLIYHFKLSFSKLDTHFSISAPILFSSSIVQSVISLHFHLSYPSTHLLIFFFYWKQKNHLHRFLPFLTLISYWKVRFYSQSILLVFLHLWSSVFCCGFLVLFRNFHEIIFILIILPHRILPLYVSFGWILPLRHSSHHLPTFSYILLMIKLWIYFYLYY